jgi:hypothetical protein
MARGLYVFGYDAEPSDERPTDYGVTNFGQSGLSLSTAPAPWNMSEHSTFDAPSKVIDTVQARRHGRRTRRRIVALLCMLVAVGVGAVAVAMRQLLLNETGTITASSTASKK